MLTDREQAIEMLEGGPIDGKWSGSIGSSNLPGISKLSEECAELITVISKMWGSGGTQHWQGDLKPQLEDEIADVLAAIDFVSTYCDLDRLKIQVRSGKKLLIFKEWHNAD